MRTVSKLGAVLLTGLIVGTIGQYGAVRFGLVTRENNDGEEETHQFVSECLERYDKFSRVTRIVAYPGKLAIEHYLDRGGK